MSEASATKSAAPSGGSTESGVSATAAESAEAAPAAAAEQPAGSPSQAEPSSEGAETPPSETAASEAEAPAEAQAEAESGDAAPTEDPTGRAKGTAPLGTPLEEGGMECANEVCLPLPPLNDMATAMGFTLTLCCTPEGECGTISNDDPCRVIPDSDPQCPRLEVMSFEVASCCTEDGKCGLNGEAFMMKPCGSLEEATEMFGDFIDFPAPQPCTAAVGEMTSEQPPAADAGVSSPPEP